MALSATTVYAQLNDTQTSGGQVNAALSFAVNVNSDFSLDSLSTSYDPGDPRAPAGVLTATGTFTNTSTQTYSDVTFEVKDITPGNEILNADGGPGGVGSTISSGETVAPGGFFNQVFEIGRQVVAPFQFLWDMVATPE